MLTGITLENFKAFKDPQFIPIRLITLVFGPNSAGKSSIVHAMAFLQHAFENKGACDPLNQKVGWETFDLGGFSNLLFGHDASQSTMMKVTLHFTKCSACWGFRLSEYGPQFSYFSARVPDPKNQHDEILVEWGDQHIRNSNKVTFSENHPLIRAASTQIWKFLCTGRSWESPEAANVSPIISERTLHQKVLHYLTSKSASLAASGFIPTYEGKSTANSDDDEVEVGFAPPTFQSSEIRQLRYNTHKQLLSNPDNIDPVEQLLDRLNWNGLLTDATLADLVEECEQVFHNRVHLGSTRHPPERKIDVSLSVHEPWRMVLNNEHLRKSINETLKQLDMPYKLEVSHIEEIHYKAGHDPISAQQQGDTRSYVERIQRTKELSFVTNGGVSLSHKDLGHGVSTTLPILVAIHASNGCFISVEQPELHIHPRIQTVLGDLFIQSSLAGWGCDPEDYIPDYYPDDGPDFYSDNQIFYDPNENNHLFIETHSEHLILRILRRIRETEERDFKDWPASLKQACPNGIKPEHVAVLYVEPPPGETNEGSTVIVLPVTPDGDFSRPWPGGFFAERSKELF